MNKALGGATAATAGEGERMIQHRVKHPRTVSLRHGKHATVDGPAEWLAALVEQKRIAAMPHVCLYAVPPSGMNVRWERPRCVGCGEEPAIVRRSVK